MSTLKVDDLSRALSVPNAAKKIGVDRATVYGWANQGVRGVRLQSFFVGGRRFILPEQLESFIAACSAGTDAATDGDDRDAAVDSADGELDALLG